MRNVSLILETLKPVVFRKMAFQKVRVYGAAGVMLLGVSVVQPAVYAVDYNSQIRDLQGQNNATAAQKSNLEVQAASLETKIANLQASITTIEGQIRDNEAQRADLAMKIAETEKEIVRQKELLALTIRRLYIDNDVSMLEKMASSRNLSDFVEKEEYGMSVQAEIQKTLERINQLKKQQEAQKARVEKLLSDSRAMQKQLDGERQEVTRLLAMNKEQQSAYAQEIGTNNAKITSLQQQQAEENARFLREQARLAEEARRRAAAPARSNGSSASPVATPAPAAAAPAGVRAVSASAYPWANAPFPNEIVDNWGMYQRQCVSYTAWKVAASGRHMPYWGGRGNAKQWDDNARAAGIPVDTNPRVGDVAVSNRGTYGHVMYVEAVYGDGTIRISQYNAGWDGRYSEATIMPNGLYFIHFR